MDLFDYIYVDTDKVVSVYSQLTGGVVEIREAVSENTRNNDNKRKYDFKIFKHDAGGSSQDKEGLKEIIKPYHSFFSELEEELITQGHMIDLSKDGYNSKIKDDEFRSILKQTFCIKVTGRCVIEDYERIKSISSVYPDITNLINKSCETALKNSEQYKELIGIIEKQESEIALITDRNKKERAKALLKSKRKEFDSALTSQKISGVDQWILDGMKTWINAFLPGIVNLRVYPTSECMEVHVFGHLKKECFFDSDSNSFHFTYGSIPTENITLVGIITSVPTQKEDDFFPLKEFQNKELSNEEGIESAFRGVFRGFDGFEQMIRTCRFPRILVYPLLVYRKAAPKNGIQTDSAQTTHR